MKIQKLKLKNLRGFHDEVSIKFDNLTAFVGKNDAGKSTILEALDIFLNDIRSVNTIGHSDFNINIKNKSGTEWKEEEISIAVCFSDIPKSIIIDSTGKTSLMTKYLLNKEGELEIVKKHKDVLKSSVRAYVPPEVFIRVFHPIASLCEDQIQNKTSELRKIINLHDIPCDKLSNDDEMLSAISKYFDNDLQSDFTEIEITTKPIWKILQTYLPLYSLFQADRKNTDGDREVQDPLKEAVKEILSDNTIQQKLNEVATTVETKLNDVANRTLAKLREMDPAIAKTLQPVTQPFESLNWQDVFKNVSIASDENIPINKRGSGIKRLILLSFFRAEVERRQQKTNLPNVIYAIEEPEISQHTANQKKLIKALSQLAETAGVQVIITTHSPTVVKSLNFTNIRIVSKDNKGSRKVINTPPQVLPYPSLNEVNYIAFSEISEEYHDELYGYITEHEWLEEYEKTQEITKREYKRKSNNKKTNKIITENHVLTRIIRDQIHHPENKYNSYHFTEDELRYSIEEMRKFIQAQNSQTDQQE